MAKLITTDTTMPTQQRFPDGKMSRDSGPGRPQRMTREDIAKNMERWMDEDSELVTGTFVNLEVRGHPARFSFKIYPGEIDFYELQDGMTYSLPRAVVRHLNNGCYKAEYKTITDEFGKQTELQGTVNYGKLKSPTMHLQRKVHRFAFKIAQYGDFDLDLQPAPALYTIETSI
jgi:hypothetical protein